MRVDTKCVNVWISVCVCARKMHVIGPRVCICRSICKGNERDVDFVALCAKMCASKMREAKN